MDYWDRRLKVFGPDKYALPLTLNGAMRDDIQAVKAGFLTLLPVTDVKGRAILYTDSAPSKSLSLTGDQVSSPNCLAVGSWLYNSI